MYLCRDPSIDTICVFTPKSNAGISSGLGLSPQQSKNLNSYNTKPSVMGLLILTLDIGTNDSGDNVETSG